VRTLLAAALLAGAAAFAQGDPAPARTPERGLTEANALYEAADYEGAAAAYKWILEQNPESPTVHYNLGNAYFRQGKPGSLGRAIACYLRAFELQPRDSDIRHNLEFALRRAGEPLIPAGVPPALFIAYHALSGLELAALHWFWYWAALLLLALCAVQERWRPSLLPLLVAAVLAWAGFGSWWGFREATGLSRPAVVAVEEAEVRSGPGTNFPVAFKAPQGRRVSRLESKGDWIEIGLPKEGLKGWIAADALEKI